MIVGNYVHDLWSLWMTYWPNIRIFWSKLLKIEYALEIKIAASFSLKYSHTTYMADKHMKKKYDLKFFKF